MHDAGSERTQVGDGGDPRPLPPAGTEGKAWADWLLNARVGHLDEQTQALVKATFAAGYRAGWQERGCPPSVQAAFSAGFDAGWDAQRHPRREAAG